MFCGHLHRYVKQAPKLGTGFPIIVNANTTAVKGQIKGNKLSVEIMNEKGETSDSFELDCKK
jgi:hypothetical protein